MTTAQAPTTTETKTPIRDALRAVRELAKATEIIEVETILEAAAKDIAELLAESDEERSFECRDDQTSWTVLGTSLDEVLDDLVDDAQSTYEHDDQDGTFFVTFNVTGEDGSEGSRRATIDPPEPACATGKTHEWRDDHDVVGGLKENPGVWGHGGGVKIHTYCRHCGCGRVVDTWGRDRSTGEQGLETVSYQPGQYVDDIEDSDAA